MELHPVILSVPAVDRGLVGRSKVRRLSAHARTALRRSARVSGLALGPLVKDARGAPLPSGGVYWSVTHKSSYVAAVVGRRPVGIDLETVRPLAAGLERRIADSAEWARMIPEGRLTFFRVWTAKEAVLKTGGRGLRDLSRCRVVDHPLPGRLVLAYSGRRWQVAQHTFDGHVAAVVTDGAAPRWHLEPPPTGDGAARNAPGDQQTV